MLASIVRIATLASAALPALVIGCGSPPAPRAPEPPAQKGGAAPAVAPVKEAGGEEARAAVLATEDGLVRVTAPRGGGWECAVEQVERIGVKASYVQCRKRTSGGTISLMAKDYRVPRALVMSAEALSKVEYPKHYRKKWEKVEYTKSGPVDHHGYPGYEVAIELSNPGGPRLHLVERVVVIDTHTLNLSADAPPDVFYAFEEVVKGWFEGADFAALRIDPKQFAALSPPALAAVTSPRSHIRP